MLTVGQSGINGQIAGILQLENILWEEKVRERTSSLSESIYCAFKNIWMLLAFMGAN